MYVISDCTVQWNYIFSFFFDLPQFGYVVLVKNLIFERFDPC